MVETNVASATAQEKTTDQLRAERAKRIVDAGENRQPDRVPISLAFGMFLAQSEGIPRHELYENADVLAEAMEKVALRYEPDAYSVMAQSSAPSRILGEVMTKWPGYGLGPDDSFQFHEGEYMKAEDYDAFLADPGDWSVRSYLPRTYSALQGLSDLPHLGMASFGHYSMGAFLSSLGTPQVASALDALAKAAQAHVSWSAMVVRNIKRMAALGFLPLPYGSAGIVEAPFDYMSDTLRGMRGIFLDMRRSPQQLLAAEEKVCDIQVQYAVARAKVTGGKSVLIPLHRGSDGFISLQMFERFYWPQLKDFIVRLIEAGITPYVFYEGCWDQRLEYLTELPKGKTVGKFQQSNIFKVKEVVGDTMGIIGGMPVSMLLSSAPSQVRELTHKLCQEVGKGGGFIMSTDISEMEGCSPELVKVWVDATKEFGKY
jgi:hypothetical protein